MSRVCFRVGSGPFPAVCPRLSKGMMSPVRLQAFADPFAAIRSNSEAFNVRIPSQFDDGSLYPANNQRRRRSMPYRQLTRMVLAMVLLVVVMNAASQQAWYEPFFPATAKSAGTGGVVAGLNGGITGSDSQNQSQSQSPGDQPSKPLLSQSVLNEAESQIASLPVDQQVRIAGSLINYLAGQQAQPLSESLNDVSFSLPPDLSQAEQNAYARTVIDAVVRDAESRIVDGAVWRSEDRDGLRLRLMQNQFGIGADDGIAASVVGVLPMLQQPDAFRGQRVQVVGRLAKAEQIQDPVDSNPIPTHWKLWIQPTSGVARPIVALVTDLPHSLAKNNQSLAKANLDDSQTNVGETDRMPTVRVTGTFFKRLAYRSSIGADLAPVVVGRLQLAQRSPASGSSEQGSSAVSPNHSISNVWVMLLASIGIGVAVAAWLMWRSSVDAKYLRDKRRRAKSIPLQVPDEF